MTSQTLDLKALEVKAYELRLEVANMLKSAGSGHAAGPFGLADIFAFLYFHQLKHDPANPESTDRDYLLVSNGHIAPIWYAALAHSGYFSVADLQNLRQLGSHLQGHPKNTSTPDVFNSSGPLGHGVPQAVGVALALKADGKDNQVYCLMSDGEQQEGAIWESMLVAAKYKLDNLTLILDWNNIQIDGHVEDIMPLPEMDEIYEEVGFETEKIDGHDFSQIADAFAEDSEGKPKLIMAQTIGGKGVSFAENDPGYHDWKASSQEAEQAIQELENTIAKLKDESDVE